MAKELQDIVERALAQVLERHLPRLQAEIVQSVLAELPAVPALVDAGAATPMPGDLVEAIAGIHGGTTLPLVLKDKVAALLYADGGAEGLLDAGSLEVLVMATSAWLEVAALRKQAQHKEALESVPMAAPVAASVHTVSSYSDPFASLAPKHFSQAPEPEPAAQVVKVAASAASASAAAAPAADPFRGLSPEDADTHRKAQRFARLLVDEIKLYNQAKVNEGRRNRDLYDRLKEDIEKSRTTYQKRYGDTTAASGDDFQREFIRSLAEDDLVVMGASFKK